MLKSTHIYPVSVMSLPSWEPSRNRVEAPLRLWSSHSGDVMDILKVLGEFSLPQFSQNDMLVHRLKIFYKGWGNTPSQFEGFFHKTRSFSELLTGGSHHSTKTASSWFMETGWVLIAPPQLQLRCFTESFSITRYLVLSFDWFTHV